MNSVSVANLVEAINLTVYSGEEYLEEKRLLQVISIVLV